MTGPLPTWLAEDEAIVHHKIFSAENGDYRGGLNWYKAQIDHINAADEASLPTERHYIDKPTLFVTCTRDAVVIPAVSEKQMRPFVKNIEVKSLDCGHWVQLEATDAVNHLLQEFFDRLL